MLPCYSNSDSLLSVYLMVCPDVKAEYKRLQRLAQERCCSMEDIVRDLMKKER